MNIWESKFNLNGSRYSKHTHVDQIPIITVRFGKYRCVLVHSGVSTDPFQTPESGKKSVIKSPLILEI